VLTAEEARAEAKKWLGDRAKGKDPIAERAAAGKSETVEQFCRRYLEATKKNLILGKRGRPKKTSTLANRSRQDRAPHYPAPWEEKGRGAKHCGRGAFHSGSNPKQDRDR
jgi:hypothetical protein